VEELLPNVRGILLNIQTFWKKNASLNILGRIVADVLREGILLRRGMKRVRYSAFRHRMQRGVKIII
jgi:hypothetical protein